jgi:protein O-mannosyl-transferase
MRFDALRRLASLYRDWLMAAALACVTGITFIPALRCDFISYDDPDYVTMNQHVTAGLTPSGAAWAFTTFSNSNWHPLTWLSLQMDASLYWPSPRGFHLTSVLLHSVNAALLFLALRALTGAFWRSAAVALLFAVHPLRVESVAWVSERKDVLSSLFGLLALWAYAGYARRPSVWRYAPVLVAFVLSLMCKPMLVTLPCLLLVLDWWPLRRAGASNGSPDESRTVGSPHQTPRRQQGNDVTKTPRSIGTGSVGLITASPAGRVAIAASGPKRGDAISNWRATWFPLVVEKLPLFALVIASAAVTYRAQLQQSAVGSLVTFPLPLRIENAAVSYGFYLWKTVWPTDLAVYYPHPIYDKQAGGTIPPLTAAGAMLLLAALTAGAAVARWRAPFLLAGWLWFLGTLVPVIGLVQVGSQAYADRYTYFPQVGILIALCWGVAALVRDRGRLALAACAAAAVALAITSYQQLGFWKDSVALWRHTLAVTFSTTTAETNLGTALEQTGDIAGAAECYRAALAYEPNNARVHVNMGNALFLQNRLDEAIAQLREAVRLEPNVPEILNNLGRMEAVRGNFAAASALFNRALTLRPDFSLAHVWLGAALLAQGQRGAALQHLNEAVEQDPGSGEAHFVLASALDEQGDFAQAVPHYELAVHLAPKEAMHWFRLATARARQRRTDEAKECLDTAMRLKPEMTALFQSEFTKTGVGR